MYYPEQRYCTELMRIRRKAMLPEIAIGNVQVQVGKTVDVRDTVARGLIPARHVIIEAVEELHLHDPSELSDLLLVGLRTRVEEGEPIAGRDPEKGRRIFAPFAGVVIAVNNGRIIMQEMPEIISLGAGVRGRVTEVHEGRGVSIEATGAVIQGVWGNERNVISTLRLEPERGGVRSIPLESLDTTYQNEIIITRTTLDADVLVIAQAREFSGIIAPSMDATMLEPIRQSRLAVMLTEGFGDMRMNQTTFRLLQTLDGKQAMLDAAQPQRFTDRRPEVIVNRPTNEEILDISNKALEEGMSVRITRAPYAGEIGTIIEIPKQPVMLENGLRVRCAVVDILREEYIDVPLVSLELAGT